MTKSQLAHAAGLSVVTINKLLPDLVASNAIKESENPVQTGGRQAAAYEFNTYRELLLTIQFIEFERRMILIFYLVDLLGRIMFNDQLEEITLDNFRSKMRELYDVFPDIKLIITGILE